MKIKSLAVASTAALAFAVPLCHGFTYLDHPPYSQVVLGNILSWHDDDASGFRTLTYAIDDNFLPNEPPETRAAAIQSILTALQSWSASTCGFISFDEAPYSPVENHDSTPTVQFEGPSIAEWIAMGQPADLPFGWGANIDFFSRPRGYTMISNGIEYRMRQGILGFTAIHRNGNRIESVDIYLNDNFDWSTIIPVDPPGGGGDDGPQWPVYGGGRPIGSLPGGPAIATGPSDPGLGDTTNFTETAKKRGVGRFSCSGGFCSVEGHEHGTAGDAGEASTPEYDVETFIVHELGHALGLDHPDQAGGQGGAFMDPYTGEQLPPADGNDESFVMFSYYTGIKRSLTEDEVGGLAFLYPNLAGDLELDGILSLEDALLAIELWQDGGATPWQVRTLDVVIPNGQIDLEEVFWLIEQILTE